jgi:hypothetical protein
VEGLPERDPEQEQEQADTDADAPANRLLAAAALTALVPLNR